MKSIKEMLHWSAFTGYLHAADAFVKGRPGYPPEVDKWLQNVIKVNYQTVVIDLGAGTGKFTQHLIDLGAKVIAVEPVQAMLDKFKARYPNARYPQEPGFVHDPHKKYEPDLTGYLAAAESLPPQIHDHSVDVVICAHAFHWFANKEAMTEIHRVLKPGGRLVMLWNLRDTREPWVAEVAGIVSEVAGESPRFYSQKWREVFPFGKFAPLHEHHFHHLHKGSPEDVIINRIKSISFIASKPQAEQDAVLARVRESIANHPDLKGKAEVSVPYDTAAFHTVKILP
jgi:SAM-dependent methyltransferase